MSPSSHLSQYTPTHRKNGLCAVVCLFLLAYYLFHFYKVAFNAVDIPFWDDWIFFPGTSPTWVFDFDNEHRTVPTKLLILFQYWLNGWDIRLTLILNFLIFGGVILSFCLFLKWATKGTHLWSILLLVISPMSPVFNEVHHWGIGSVWHFPLIFGTLGIWLLFRDTPRSFTKLGGILLLGVCMFSVGAGMVFSFSAATGWALYEASKNCYLTRPLDWKNKIIFVGLLYLCFCGFLFLWFYSYKKIPQHKMPAMPWTAEFLSYFGVMIQNGLGLPYRISFRAPWIGILVVLTMVAAPFYLWLRRSIRQKQPVPTRIAALLAFAFGIIGIAAITSYGRGNFPITTATSGRYTYFVAFLFPVSLALWVGLWEQRSQHRAVLLSLFCAVFLLLQLRLFPYFHQYDVNKTVRMADLQMISDYYKNGQPSPLYLKDFWLPMDEFLQKAKSDRYSFYRKMSPQN